MGASPSPSVPLPGQCRCICLIMLRDDIHCPIGLTTTTIKLILQSLPYLSCQLKSQPYGYLVYNRLSYFKHNFCAITQNIWSRQQTSSVWTILSFFLLIILFCFSFLCSALIVFVCFSYFVCVCVFFVVCLFVMFVLFWGKGV